MKYKAIIWDLDGTLLNTLQDLTDAVNHSLEKYGLPVPPAKIKISPFSKCSIALRLVKVSQTFSMAIEL